jgi:hypothetical protein
MRAIFVFFFICLSAMQLCYASVEVPSALEELPQASISDVVSAEVLQIKRPPETADWEYEIRIIEVLKGNLKTDRITAIVHYFSRPGMSIKSPRSGLESRMEVGKVYFFMFGPHEAGLAKLNLIRAETLDKREEIGKRFLPGRS